MPVLLDLLIEVFELAFEVFLQMVFEDLLLVGVAHFVWNPV